MCGRYHLDEDDATLGEIIALLARSGNGGAVKAGGEIAPTDTVPVIARSRRGERGAFAMRWGYDAPGGLIINARSETAHEKPLFSDGMKQRRCLIPMSWYFEWEARGREKVRYAIRPKGNGLVYLAGLYRLRDTAGGAEFVVLTRDASQDVAFIHPRMPVMLPGEVHAQWLDPACSGQEILRASIERLDYGAA